MAKSGIGSLLLAGAAAFGLYKLSKMSSEERSRLVNKGKQLVNDNLSSVKKAFGQDGTASRTEARHAVDNSLHG